MPSRSPSLSRATAWLNIEALGPAELLGHVVLVNFWTWTCINWLRQEPYVRAWSQAYRGDGLVVIGVHTPEFSFEQDIDGVSRAIGTRAIDYPVAVDNAYEIWGAFANRYWPALYFVDADGKPGASAAGNAVRGDAEAMTGTAAVRDYPVGGLTVVQFPNNHMSYLLTWYALAIMSAVAGWFVIRLELRKRAD